MRNNARRQHEQRELPVCDSAARSLLSQVAAPIWFYDPAKHCMRWANPAALGFWGAVSVDELGARDFTPASRGTAERLESIRLSVSNGSAVSERWTLYPHGKPRQVDCRFTGVHLETGELMLMIEGQLVATDQVVDGAELRALEAVRQTPLMISMLTPAGHWLMHNPAAAALVERLELHNIPGMDNFLMLFAEKVDAQDLRERAMRDGSAQGVLRMAGRSFRMHAITLRRLNDPVTAKLSLMLVQQDVTRPYRLERRLQKALERERTIVETQRHFLSLTSHEFRTPLSIIDGAARRIEKMIDRDDGPLREKLVTIRNAVRRMNEAVNHTLAAAQIEEGKYRYSPVEADIVPLVRHVIEGQTSIHPSRQFDIDLPTLPHLTIDPARAEQVLENILTNAIKYSPSGSPVEIRARKHGRSVEISVTDHGIGIPAEDQAKLFTRFFRSRNAKSIKGTGIGLHTVRYFMDMHGGSVKIASKEGEGSTVTLGFPLPKD